MDSSATCSPTPSCWEHRQLVRDCLFVQAGLAFIAANPHNGGRAPIRYLGTRRVGDDCPTADVEAFWSRGASNKTLKTVSQGTVRPHLEYGSTAWSTTAKTDQQALDKVQNQALRLITGAMRSTPITEMETHTGVQPLGQRRDAKILMQTDKFR